MQLEPIEIEALLQGAGPASDATDPTVEMIPLERPARGTNRRPRVTLRVEEIRPKKR